MMRIVLITGNMTVSKKLEGFKNFFHIKPHLSLSTCPFPDNLNVSFLKKILENLIIHGRYIARGK